MVKCRNCFTNLKEFLSLGNIPLVNSLPEKPRGSEHKTYRAALGYCTNCTLVQMLETIEPALLFTDYVYTSGTSSYFREHAAATALHLKTSLGLTGKSRILEIGCNDGTQLTEFARITRMVTGIDPAENIVKLARDKNLTVINGFFSEQLADKLKKESNLQSDLIYGANVLAHMPQIGDAARGVRLLLAPGGTAVFEFPYITGLVENKFDTVYHEHVFYFSLLSVTDVFARSGLDVYDAETTPVQGGSLRIYACHKNTKDRSVRYKELIRQEKYSGLNLIGTYRKIAPGIRRLKLDLLRKLNDLKSNGFRIAGYGAAAKGVVLLNVFGIDGRYLDFVADKSPQKQDRYIPGVGLPVKDPASIIRLRPDYVLILCWNIMEEVMRDLADYHRSGGKFIIPVPVVSII